jgi:hypothetical protein
LRTIIYFVIPCLVFSVALRAQSPQEHHYPDGIYPTLETFLSHTPDTAITYRKLNLGVPTSKAFQDTLVDHVWFIDRKNDVLKKLFAVVHDGEIYFQDFAVKNHLMPEYGSKSSFSTDKFHRVQLRGRYLYCETNFNKSDPTAAILMGMMFGAIGGAVAGLTTTSDEIEAPLVFDMQVKKFFAFHSRLALQTFMTKFHPEMNYDVEKGRLDLESVKQLFADLNSKS